MFSYRVYNGNGSIIDQGEQEEPVDVEALIAKNGLMFWKRVWYVDKFNMTIYNCGHRGRITVKRIKEEESND